MQSVPCPSSPPPPPAFFHEDQLDRLPDALVLIILTKLADARYLGRCSAVSKRLCSLVPLVDRLSLHIDGVITSDDPSSPTPQPLFSRLRNLVLSTVCRSNRPRYSPAKVLTNILTNFTHLRHLTIVLPSGEVDTKDGELLIWRAEYGLDPYRCYILVGTHMSGPECNSFPTEIQRHSLQPMIRPLTMAMRRLRLLDPIIWKVPSLRSLVFKDADGQGTLSVGAESRAGCPQEILARLTSAPVPQNQISAEVRYATYLELAGGIGIQGATLMTVNAAAGESGCRRVAEAFHGPYRAAVEALLKHKAYLLTEYQIGPVRGRRLMKEDFPMAFTFLIKEIK